MAQVRIVVEYSGPTSAPLMRWERVAQTGNFTAVAPPKIAPPASDTFELLGRAFEVAQREEGAPFRESLIAFFRGAMVAKEDLTDIAQMMGEPR